MPIKLANGSAAGLYGGGGGVYVDWAGWGVAELDVGGDIKEEKPGDGDFALLLFWVAGENREGPGTSVSLLALIGLRSRTRNLLSFVPNPKDIEPAWP